MEPILLPLNDDFTSYHVLLPLQGKEFSFAVHHLPPQKDAGKISLHNAKLECEPEFRALLAGLEHVVQQRLDQSLDLPMFVLELKDILERIVKARPESTVPSPAFYTNLFSSLDSIGWEHLSSLSPDLTAVHLRVFDRAGREHIVQIDLPPEFPDGRPTASVDLPISIEIRHLQGTSLNNILEQFQTAVEQFQDFWTVMEDIDSRVWIIEPEHPSRASSFRRIALGGHCSLSIVVDPMSPRAIPECRFFGSDAVLAPLKKKLNGGYGKWDPQQLVVSNLENVLELRFPSPQDTENEDMSADCGICYAYRAPEGTFDSDKDGHPGNVPDRVCDNANCARPFHSNCLTEWLRSITTTRQSFDVFFGRCPYCSHPIAVRSTPG